MTELDETIAVLKAGRVVAQWRVDLEAVPAVAYSRGSHTMLVVPLDPDGDETGITVQFYRDGVPSTHLIEFVLTDN